MKTNEIETKESTNKFFASQDAKLRSYAASTHYLDSERTAAERVKLGLELCYYAKNVFITYRKKFITVKIEDARVRNKEALADLEQDYEQRGITKIVSAQGIIYRIPKQ
jgi:hypothetical protein